MGLVPEPILSRLANRVAQSINSTGYYLAPGMTELSFRQADPASMRWLCCG
jgi:hypothetical protein